MKTEQTEPIEPITPNAQPYTLLRLELGQSPCCRRPCSIGWSWAEAAEARSAEGLGEKIY